MGIYMGVETNCWLFSYLSMQSLQTVRARASWVLSLVVWCAMCWWWDFDTSRSIAPGQSTGALCWQLIPSDAKDKIPEKLLSAWSKAQFLFSFPCPFLLDPDYDYVAYPYVCTIQCVVYSASGLRYSFVDFYRYYKLVLFLSYFYILSGWYWCFQWFFLLCFLFLSVWDYYFSLSN